DPPFGSATTVRLLRLHTEQMPTAPSVRRREIGPVLDAAGLRALAKAPGDRFQSVVEFARALEPAAAANVVLPRTTRSTARQPRATLTSVAETTGQRAEIVGRTREMAELVERLEAAIAGECQLVLISGEAGVGKTRLADEIEAVARGRGIRALRGRFAE